MKIKTLMVAAILSCAASVATADMANYTLTFEGFWTDAVGRPGGAHFSPFIGSSHQAGGSFMAVGQMASTGVENVAEVGSTGVLASEINNDIAAGTADQLFFRPGDIGPEQVFTMSLDVDSDFSYLSYITMIAPSPDWFVGVHDLNLRSNGQWINQLQIDLNSYDAGTEDGTQFSTNNSATNPQDVIRALDDAEPNGVLAGAGSIARLTLVRNVPEPGSLLMLSMFGLVIATKRRRKV